MAIFLYPIILPLRLISRGTDGSERASEEVKRAREETQGGTMRKLT